jgi:hypothetical protein
LFLAQRTQLWASLFIILLNQRLNILLWNRALILNCVHEFILFLSAFDRLSLLIPLFRFILHYVLHLVPTHHHQLLSRAFLVFTSIQIIFIFVCAFNAWYINFLNVLFYCFIYLTVAVLYYYLFLKLLTVSWHFMLIACFFILIIVRCYILLRSLFTILVFFLFLIVHWIFSFEIAFRCLRFCYFRS